MSEYKYNSEELGQITEYFSKKKERAVQIKGLVEGNITTMEANWNGDETNLAGRDKDFAEITSNIDVIINNLDTISKFLAEKNTDFGKINYK